jgi:hypothetical protein
MLYILPPPSAKPPSVWDLIINFHRREASGGSTNFNCSRQKQRKKSPSHVRNRRLDLKTREILGFTFTDFPTSPNRVEKSFTHGAAAVYK